MAPISVRYTVVGAGYNLAQALLGGTGILHSHSPSKDVAKNCATCLRLAAYTAPLISTAIYAEGGSAVWPGVYFATIALVSALTIGYQTPVISVNPTVRFLRQVVCLRSQFRRGTQKLLYVAMNSSLEVAGVAM